LGHLTRSVSTVTAALSNVSLVSQLFPFPVDGFVAFFAGVKTYNIYPHNFIYSTFFGGGSQLKLRKEVTENKMSVLNFSTTFV
jgi:hypothetical protein